MLIAFDRDEAGDRAAAKLAERLGRGGLECFRVLFPPGLDANALTASVEDPAGALGELLRAAARIGPAPGQARRIAAVERRSSSEQPAGGAERPRASVRAAPDPFPAAEPGSCRSRPSGPRPAVELVGDELRVEIDGRHWRIRGLGRVTSFEVLRLNVLVAR